MYVQIRNNYIYTHQYIYIYLHLYKYMYTKLSAGTPPLTRPFCQILVFVACGFSSYRFVGLQHSRPHAFMMLYAIWRSYSLIVLNGNWSRWEADQSSSHMHYMQFGAMSVPKLYDKAGARGGPPQGNRQGNMIALYGPN